MQVISSVAELDVKLAECDAAAKVSDTALREVFQTFRMNFATTVFADPFSGEYRDFQMELYRHIASRAYDPGNEVTKFDVEAAERTPFPFSTRSCKTAGFFTMGAGFLLHTLDLQPGARVVEFGAGWGNTTLAMAMTGLDVTAVDIEGDFCDLLSRRAKRQGVSINIVNADFMWAETVREPFDAAVFFESFHHCSDHLRLLKALRTAIKPDGRVYFAAEPIVPDFPIPWGLRMDGESLWAIRSNGWMELGYNETYFREALARTGWVATKYAYPDLGWAAVWEAKQARATNHVIVDAAKPTVITSDPLQSASEPTSPAANGPIQSELRLQNKLSAIYRSTSWRLTAPLRALGGYLRR
jgi:2-polyprenyl-3-methyl-5-hydroxy-6-metoxy-1,4-benzoquinol methylase